MAMVVSEEEAGVLLPIEVEGAALEGQQGPRREATRRSTSDDRALIIGIALLLCVLFVGGGVFGQSVRVCVQCKASDESEERK